MIENDIKLRTDYLITAIESAEDFETLKKTINENKEMQQKLESVIIDLIRGIEHDEHVTLS